MAITVSFTTSQVTGSPQNIVLVDSSSGTDGAAVSRRIYITNAANQYLTQDYGVSVSEAYTEFPLADGATITLVSILPQDSALYVRLVYVNGSGGVVATATNLTGFTLYNETFYYTLTQAQAQQNQPPPMIIQDSNYYSNKSILRVNIDSGNQAIELGADITTAQNCYDLATYMVTKQADYF